MKSPWLVLLTLPLLALAQEDVWEDDDWGDDDWEDEEQGLVFTGFVEAGLGSRFSDDPLVGQRNTLEDMRWRLETPWQPESLTIAL